MSEDLRTKDVQKNPSNEDNDDDLEAIPDDPEEIKKEKRRIIKNLMLICLAFLCNFIAFEGTSKLQSSLNYEEGLGTTSLSVIYGTLILSAMFTPTFLITKFGCKWMMCISIIGYVTYPLANFYPHWGTLIPSSIIVGISAAPLWAAKSTYLTTAAKRYARMNNESPDTVVNRFFGIFFLCFQFNTIVGQLISSFVLSSQDSTNLILPDCYSREFIDEFCGPNDCQEDFEAARKFYNTSSCPISQIQNEGIGSDLLYTLMGIYTGIGLLGSLIVAVFLDRITVRLNESRGAFDLLFATFKHLIDDPRQRLLVLITVYSGFEQAFLTGDFTRSYVSCPLGVNWIGFVLICYGACDSVCSFAFGRLEKYTGRYILFLMAFVINLALIIAFQIWIPYPTNTVLFFILPAFWGVADAVWQTQLNACYGVFFINNQEAAFSNYRLWESVGFVISFAYQSFLCVNTKIWVLLGVLIAGMIFYTVAEYIDRKKSREVEGPAEEISGKSNDAFASKDEEDGKVYQSYL